MRFFPCLGVLLGGLSWSSLAGAADLTITSGSATGTYIQIAKDIANVAQSAGLTVDVAESRGSVHNLERLLGFEGVEKGMFFQLAIIQEDVLADLRAVAEGNEVLERLVSQVKVVLPLYNEEVHLYVHDDANIRDIDDLRGQSVGVGVPGSGTFMTARYIYKLVDLPWDLNYVNQIGGEEGLQFAKDADAQMIDVAGAPSKLGATLSAKDDHLTLAPITDSRIYEFPGSPYRKVVIEPSTYPNLLTEPVTTAAVGAVLVAYNYTGENCEKIGRLTQAVLDALPKLQRSGHPKWKAVDPENGANREDLYECVRDAYK